jgi:hypothetical protein
MKHAESRFAVAVKRGRDFAHGKHQLTASAGRFRSLRIGEE